MMTKVKLSKHLTFKTPMKNLSKVPTTNYIAIRAAVRFLATNAFLLEVIEVHPNAKKCLAVDQIN